MSIISRIKGWFNMIFKDRIKEEFNIESITSTEMDTMIARCVKIYQGRPEWLDDEDHIKTINFAKAICSETARLVTLGIKITVDGSARAKWLQEEVDKIYFQLRDWVEYGCTYGTVVLKPNGEGVELVTPSNFVVTDSDNGEITGIVFMNRKTTGNKFYVRLEYHRFVDGVYVVTNRCYLANNENEKGRLVDIKNTPWSNLEEELSIQNITKPLYGVLKMPHANNVDVDSPIGLPVFSDAIEELKDLDIAYSRNSKEIHDSKRTVLLDSDRLLPTGGKVAQTGAYFKNQRETMGLPDYVKNVYGNGTEDFYQEINPQLNTDTRLSGINALLSQIGYKVGYSNGYFVFNETTGIQTATGVEAEQQRTIQLIKDMRDKLESCMNGLLYALNVFADLYGLAPVGNYEPLYSFGDITYNYEDEKSRWWGYVMAGKVPSWMYFMKFEGMSEEEARTIEKEMQPKQPTLFGSEE
jgi:A118 family predicted phage portal protein